MADTDVSKVYRSILAQLEKLEKDEQRRVVASLVTLYEYERGVLDPRD